MADVEVVKTLKISFCFLAVSRDSEDRRQRDSPQILFNYIRDCWLTCKRISHFQKQGLSRIRICGKSIRAVWLDFAHTYCA